VLLKCWFGFVAVSCGVAVAWMVDGKSLPFLWLVAAFGVLAVVTFAPRRLTAHRHPTFRHRHVHDRPTARETHRTRIEREPGAPRPRAAQPARTDQELVAELLAAVRPDDVTRLRREEFTSAWRSREIATYERLLSVGTTLPRPSDSKLVEALHALLVRTAAFLDYHDGHTIADPLVGSGEWRVVHANGVHANARNGGDAAESLSAELRQRAAEVANAYEHLVLTAARTDEVPSEAPVRLSPTQGRGLLA